MTRYELLKLITIGLISYLPAHLLTRTLLYYDVFSIPQLYNIISQTPYLCYFLMGCYYYLNMIVTGCAFGHSLRHLMPTGTLSDPLISNLVGITVAQTFFRLTLFLTPQTYLNFVNNPGFYKLILKILIPTMLYETVMMLTTFVLFWTLVKRYE